MLVVQDTNPAVRVDGVYAFVVFASCELVRKSVGWLALETATGSPLGLAVFRADNP